MPRKITNTTQEVIANPVKGLIKSITSIEQESLQEAVQSSELPAMNSKNELVLSVYAMMGIKIIEYNPKKDKLFVLVELPKGWTKKSGNGYYTNLLDDKGRVRAEFFYKAAFYDRSAFIRFKTRYDYNLMHYLPEEERGHFKEERVARPANELDELREEYREHKWFAEVPKIVYVTEKKWIPKYKDIHEETRNTPCYFEITDGSEVIYKSEPKFYKTKYSLKKHSEWWRGYEKFKQQIKNEAITYLNTNYPKWNNIHSYWD